MEMKIKVRLARRAESADQALEEEEWDNDYELGHDEDAEADEGEDEQGDHDDDLEQESEDLLADAGLHDSERTISPRVNDDSNASAAVHKGRRTRMKTHRKKGETPKGKTTTSMKLSLRGRMLMLKMRPLLWTIVQWMMMSQRRR